MNIERMTRYKSAKGNNLAAIDDRGQISIYPCNVTPEEAIELILALQCILRNINPNPAAIPVPSEGSAVPPSEN